MARDRATVYLRGLGPRLREHCAAQSIEASEFILSLIAKALDSETPAAKPTTAPPRERGGRRKLSVLLAGDVYKALEKPAGEAGLTVAALVARLAAERAGKPLPPVPTAAETAVLVESNYELRALGRNINQIARSLNAYPGKVTASERNELTGLAARIDAHVRKSASLLLALNPPRAKRPRKTDEPASEALR